MLPQNRLRRKERGQTNAPERPGRPRFPAWLAALVLTGLFVWALVAQASADAPPPEARNAPPDAAAPATPEIAPPAAKPALRGQAGSAPPQGADTPALPAAAGKDAPPQARSVPAEAHVPPGQSAAPQAPAVQRRQLPPLRQMVTSPFGPRRIPGWAGRRGGIRQHAGVDIRARIGWPVAAFRDGVVHSAGANGLLGLAVTIRQKDGMQATYAHLSKVLVTPGQEVAAGDIVGLVGCTGRTTGSHLHFGLKTPDGTAVDPLRFLTSAGEVLRPGPEQIPEVLEAQACGPGSGPVMRGPNGRPVRLGLDVLRRLEGYKPPPLPTWKAP